MNLTTMDRDTLKIKKRQYRRLANHFNKQGESEKAFRARMELWAIMESIEHYDDDFAKLVIQKLT